MLCAALPLPGLPARTNCYKAAVTNQPGLSRCKLHDTVGNRQWPHVAACWVHLVQVAILQVVALQLGSGHHHTAVCCAWLPCSSVERQRAQMPRMALPDKEFVVVASFAEEGHPGGLQTVHPLLTVFEFRVEGSR